jgi:hypothetical protein
MLLKERWKGREEEENVRRYWMIVRKIKDTGI